MHFAHAVAEPRTRGGYPRHCPGRPAPAHTQTAIGKACRSAEPERRATNDTHHNAGLGRHQLHGDRRPAGDPRPDLRRGRGDRLELLPAAAAPRRRGRAGVLPQAGRRGGRQHDRAARRDDEARRERQRRRAAQARRGVSAVSKLSLRRDPIRLVLSRGPWAAAWYLLGYLAVGWLLFAIALSTAVAGAGLSITFAGLPVLVAAAAAIRWCADVERARLRPLARIRGTYRQVTGHGIMAQLRARWRDPATWRDVAYLVGMYVPLLALDAIVLAVWLVFLAGITLPIWYWAPWKTIHGVRYHGSQLGYFPNGPHGPGGWGLYVNTLPEAFAVAAVFLILFLLFNYVLVLTARAHAAVARGLLGPAEDPLREAREVLGRPGPLSSNLRA